MSSTFIERSPETEKDKSLILIMDGEGNVTTDPVYLEKLVTNQKIPEMGIKIVRLDSSQTENENDDDPENKQELKLTVEEIYPENLELTTGEPVSTTPMEILPGPSNEHISHDIVDPFSQMDPEQLQRLERALASEQAKQILGENVTAMLDMLSVDDSPAAFLQNSIKNDHCYTNLLPSSDPNGPSFLTAVSDNRQVNGESSKGKGKAKLGTPIKGRKIVALNPVKAGGSILKKTIVKDCQPGPVVKQTQVKQSVLDYGMPVGLPQLKPQDEVEDFTYEEDVDVEDSEGSAGVDDDNLSDEDYNNRSTRGKRKPRKNKKKLVVRKVAPSRSYPRPAGAGKFGKRSATTPEVRARNEKLNDAMSKIVQWMDYESKEEETKGDVKAGPKKLKTYKGKSTKEEGGSEGEKVVKEMPKPSEEAASPVKVQTPKYPKRENRKPPAHLAEALGPALFSAPDMIRRISTGEDIPQTPPEKKNFTVGAHSSAKLGERGIVKAAPVKVETVPKEVVNHVKEKPKTPTKDLPKLAKPGRSENGDVGKVGGESRHVVVTKAPAAPSDAGVVHKIANIEIQKIIEKQPTKPVVYEEDHDNSDDNIDDNYYLDPTQMDQSLLMGFGQAANKSEEQLLQEAILLQEQLIESNKGIELVEGSSVILENQGDMPFETETIEDIQNEITSAMLVGQKEEKNERRKAFPMDQGSGELKVREAQKEIEAEPSEDGTLVVDESRPEDRRRNSAKRRRSDEVSDLDSDMDDALSEASWNSEDDPDRLWCICRKPHNNRFMICCDICEEWFHGKCVGITKAIGKQMEQDGLEWSCPNCTKKKKMEENVKEAEKIKLLKEKLAQSIKDQQQKIKESQKLKSQGVVGKDKQNSNLKQTKISDFSQKTPTQWSEEEETVGRKCIMCKGPVRENSIYCSDDCIRKHSQHAISQLMADGNKKQTTGEPASQGEGVKVVQKVRKEDPRIVVMDSNSKKFLKGQNAPTAANLATWLKENPSYRVVYQKSDKPGKILLTSRKVVKIQSTPIDPTKVYQPGQKLSDSIKSTQLKLAISPNSKQINISPQPSATGAPGKKIYQIVTTTGPTGGKQTTVKAAKQTEIINAIPLQVKTILPKGVAVKGKAAATVTPTAGKASAGSTATPPKEQPAQPKKRKEKIQKQPSTAVATKDVKMGQTNKVEEAKDKEEKKKDADQQIRESVKKSLADSLKARVQECKDMEYNEDTINGLALKIEEKLYKHFENKVDTKYKSKYRSLVFNIRDPKNETLFKKIVDNSITPKELVKLSPEELASQELARWREKENQHQLEIIKKTELELMAKGNTYIMKSHKGEQVIESDHSGHVAAVATEIDPNTPAQELVSALNSASSTAQSVAEEESKSGGDEDSESSSIKAKKKDRERRRSRDRKRDRREKDRKSSRSSSRSRSHRSKDKKRSRSRDRDRDKSRYRHKDKKYDKKDRDSKDEDSKDGENYKGEHKEEIKAEQSADSMEKNEISTTETADEKVFKKPVEDDDADREPSSTVIIKTPDINMEEEPEPEPEYLWKGTIVMADVAKFSGAAIEISGDCSGLSVDIGEKVDVVGRIPFLTVWDYIARMKKMGTKDILVIKIVAVAEEEKTSYDTLYTYLSKRSRIGVIGKTSEAVKDFYLYPLASRAPLPKVLLPLDGPKYEGDSENILLGIVVRNKHRGRHFRISSTDHATQNHSTKMVTESLPLPDTVPDRSYTPPLPDKDHNRLLKKDRQKRKIRVRVDFNSKESGTNEEEEGDDDDSPYSPEDSDEDLPPLPKIAKPTVPSIPKPTPISKLLSPSVPLPPDSNLQDPAEIQRKIEEMNRAIEEQTQQIQTLTSAVPKLAAGVLPTLPLLTSSILATPSAAVSNSGPTVPVPLPSQPTEKVQLPLISSEVDEESSNPSRSFTPPLQTKEKIPFLPGEVTSKISLPSNLQEILNSIQKKPGSEDSGSRDAPVEDIMKTNNPEINKALNVLSQTKSLLTSFSSAGSAETEEKGGGGSQLRSMTDQELLQKAKEMEMESYPPGGGSLNPCPPQPLPPGVQDIPLLSPSDAFANPVAAVPPPPFFSNPLVSSTPLVDSSSFMKLGPEPEDKKPGKKFKLDPKAVFESEGVPDFNIPGHSWDDKKSQKMKNFKIDIKLGMNALERKPIDTDHFDIESITKVSDFRDVGERKPPTEESSSYDVDERIMAKGGEEKYRSGIHDRRRPGGDGKRDWKYDRRHWDDGRRYKDEYRRYDRRERPGFRKDRFDDKRNRHLQKEWDGSIKSFEERQRRRNEEIRREELRRSRQRADSTN